MKFLFLIAYFSLSLQAFEGKKCFAIKENNQVLAQDGDCEKRHSPCSTFKIAISLMGYNEEILIDDVTPELPFQEGYTDFLEIWKQPQNPISWMKNSCVWYSQVITAKIGLEKFKDYVAKFAYGNQDISGDKNKDNGITNSWLSSSLQISVFEQIAFLEKLLDGTLPVSQKAQELTRKILFVEELANGWKLYGKTGSGCLLNADGSKNPDRKIGWFVGWIENRNRKIVFAHYIEDDTPVDSFGGPRSKEMAKEKLFQLIKDNTDK
jgi:beta-lactamase class D